jgi:hypothetical protein
VITIGTSGALATRGFYRQSVAVSAACEALRAATLRPS